ncbi:MAG: hypothetical protein AAGD35_02530 [Actinomycetota bacterium]
MQRSFGPWRHLFRARVALLVAAATAVAGCVVPGLPGGGDGLDTAPAAERIAAIANEAAPDVGNWEELPDCPFSPGGAVLTTAAAELDSLSADAALSAELFAGVDFFSFAQPPLLACDRFDDVSNSSLGVFASQAPDDMETYIREFLTTRDGDDEGEVTPFDYSLSGEHRGGRFHRICVNEPADDNVYCEVDWVDDHVLIGFYVGGDGSQDIDMAAMEDGLARVLDDVLAGLAADTAG